MQRKSILPVLILLVFTVGCGLFQRGTRSNEEGQPTPSPTTQTIVKVVDVPAIYGKSVADAKKFITGGKITYESKDTISYQFPQGNLSIDSRAAAGKTLHFYLKDNASGKFYDFAADTPQQVANFVGIDVAGKTPSSSNDTAVTYEDLYNGIPVQIVFVRKGSGNEKFDSLMVSLKRKS